MFAAIVRWIDKDLDRLIAQPVALIAAAGAVPGALVGWNWFTFAIGVAWAAAWTGLWSWRLVVWVRREQAKKRRRLRREAKRDAKAASAKAQATE